MCQTCGIPNCNCVNFNSNCVPCSTPCPSNCRCSRCCSTGCPVKLDMTCIIYHKNNSAITALTNLGLTNGATLELVVETIDTYIGQIKANTFTLPYLRDDKGYTINTVNQLAVAIDTQMAIIDRFKGDVNADPVTLVDGDYWYRADLDQLRIRLNGVTRQITII